MTEIRDLVNMSWKHYQLRQDHDRFSQLVSAMDTIEDAEEAISAFDTEAEQKKVGKMYLITYGLFQAFFLQQDAAQHLCDALGIPNKLDEYPQLKVVREVRNDTVGHPTKRGKAPSTSYHQISRPTMSKDGFTLLSSYSDGTRQFRDISIPHLIADQRKYLTDILTKVVNELTRENKAHKEKFRVEKLANLFPQTLGYAFEKVSQSVHSSNPPEIGLWGLDTIKDTVHAFHEAVARRDMEVYKNLADDIRLIDHSIVGLGSFLNQRKNDPEQAGDESDAYIYFSFLRSQLESLQEYAKELDADYEDGAAD